ncbi:phage holin family protein [Nesterenkonia sp. NBAIMH1]|uniref:phage holin family protein n=1 Tax=Nesterenkonia sp. NBAIMH1 TaxID=2600320 RepID=UPI00143D29ED|nr:phage holin family protein [Nesterenkonia sp. NBAIMH1]
MAENVAPPRKSKTSTLDVAKLLLRLGPKQINDEIGLALAQMKAKGVAAGVAAALMVIGLVFVAFLVVALIVAAIAGLSLIFQMWAAALIVGGAFLLIALIFVLVGLAKLKAAMPLKPEDAIRGFRLDLGVAREGTSFDPASLDRADEQKRQAKAEAKRQAAEQRKTPGTGEPEKPNYTELLRRTSLRRDHIAGLQDQFMARLPKGKQADDELASSPVEPDPRAEPRSARSDQAREFVAGRWKPLSVAAGATAAGAVFLRELVKR